VFGTGAEQFWAGLSAGRPVGAQWSPDDEQPSFLAATISDDYRPNPGIPRDLTQFLDRGSLIALDAALQAVESAGLGAGSADTRRFAVVDGLPFRAPGQPATFVPYAHLIARALGARGAVHSVAGAEASGAVAVAGAARMVALGQADVAIAGAGQGLQRQLLQHLEAQGAAKAPPRPFDVAHGGALPAEGAAYLVIESEEHARARGASPFARIAAVGETFDPAAGPLALGGPAEVGRAMQSALASAGYVQEQVDLLLSGADGRPACDFAEGFGALRTFGRHPRFAGVTTVAGTAGQPLAASGPLALVAAIEAIRRQEVFPVAGFETAEQDLELPYVRSARPERVECVLVSTMGVGGVNVATLLTR
jgi:3-oxoacyl-(acyl-carrier-protein) synthase